MCYFQIIQLCYFKGEIDCTCTVITAVWKGLYTWLSCMLCMCHINPRLTRIDQYTFDTDTGVSTCSHGNA